MFTGTVEGVRLLKDGNVTVTLTCAGDNLQAIANSRAGDVTVYSANEAPVTDSRIVVLTHLHSVALQIAEAIDRELAQEITDEEWKACHPEQMTIMEDFGLGLKILEDVAKERDGVEE